MSKCKVFYTTLMYRMRQFEVRFCAKTIAEAAKRINMSEYYIKTYASYSKAEKQFDNIIAKATNHGAFRDIGHGDEIDYEEAKKIIDNISRKKFKEWQEGLKE